MSRAEEILLLADSVLDLDEVRSIKTISYRGGKRHRRVRCPPGFKLIRPRGSPPGTRGQCKRMGAVERRRRSVSSRRRARKLKGRMSKTLLKRARTNRRRGAAGL